MLETLSDRLQGALSGVRSRGALSEDDIKAAMRQVRLALLEADVNLAVVKQFTAAVGERARGRDVLESLNPGQQVVGIVSHELTELMGGAGRELVFASAGPTVILLAGLQGSGKTTACAKLAVALREERGLDVALAACDLQRPAAVDQLVKVGGQAGATVYERGTAADPVEVAGWALERARAEGRDVLIVDTAGRLNVDVELMDELAAIRSRVKPHNVVLVLDAMTGQEAVRDRGCVRRERQLRRCDPEQARRRRARRCRAIDPRQHRQADPLRVDRREARRLRAFPSRSHGPADPRDG